MFPGGNLLSATTIEQVVPEVKLCHQHVQITVCLSMPRGSALIRVAPLENTVVNKMTSTTLLKIGGVSDAERRPHRDDL
jgi:hypothetical protein